MRAAAAVLMPGERNDRMEKVIRLSPRQRLQTKPLWSEIFHEDSQQFTDYYYKEKMPQNTGFGMYSDGGLRSMLFLTPYTGRVLSESAGEERFVSVSLHYIVGVGTKKEYRHRGYMDRVLREALCFLEREREPFTFLMPADPEIYLPYQFSYIYDRPEYKVRRQAALPAVPMKTEEAGELAGFANTILERRCQLFLERDCGYYERQRKESLCQDGNVYVWKDGNRIAGYYLYAKEDGRVQIQEAALDEAYRDTGALETSEDKKPVIMARITCVEAMLSLLRTRESGVRVTLKVTDPLIPENNGIYFWKAGRREGSVRRMDGISELQAAQRREQDGRNGGEQESGACSFSPKDIEAQTDTGGLTQFVFGRKKASECFFVPDAGREEEIWEMLDKIRPLTRLCINEIV